MKITSEWAQTQLGQFETRELKLRAEATQVLANANAMGGARQMLQEVLRQLTQPEPGVPEQAPSPPPKAKKKAK